jgi:2-polyprenyl-3-methyl-5-hydroxy-6-metoxy-1,4-benzoquinol methylase
VDASGSTILDVGCGSAKHEGAFGIDIRSDAHADLVHDLRLTPWPVPGDHYSRVFCQDIIEHVPDVSSFVRELWRVCARGAEVEIRTPHFSSWYSYNDPTHLHSFGYFFLDHYTRDNATAPGGGASFATSSAGSCFPELIVWMA